MSDAIVLDVVDTAPVRLDAGDADPIAREEITELAERVEAIEADYVTSEDVMGALGGEAPALVSGSSRAILGDTETASWMERATAADGAALIESVKGNTLRWNQLYNSSEISSKTMNGVTFTVNADGSITASGTATEMAIITLYGIPVVAGHKHLFKGCPSGGSWTTYFSYLTGAGFPYSGHIDTGAGNINVPSTTSTASYVLARIESGQTVDNLKFRPQLFDLTAMFGAGNEPSTVAEFEALFPLPYYPYDAGSLLPVRMEGVETVAADESWSSQRTIPASTYFPDGMRSAGSVYDELRADAAVTRVGERAYQSGDESDASVITDGTVTHYALATPTTTPIDPPLPLSYRVGAGGTERVMVASGTTSAPPVFVTRYPVNLTDLAESIAPRESATAEANHAVGDLIMLGWTLCKVTTSIARGETITIGTNVTRTSVAAEIAALS